jgi:N-acetylglucosaminyldiphosphoundecaprenol N-acetyl-beta-D-mannosaminyltransferase
MQTVDILGFPVANVDMAEAVAWAAAWLEGRGAGSAGESNANSYDTAGNAGDSAGSGNSGTNESASGSAAARLPAARIVTANAEILYHSYSDPALGELLRGADLIVPDGAGVVQAAATLGSPVKGRVAGADLLDALAAWAAANGRSVYLLGASKEAVRGAADALQKKHPTLAIAGCRDGYFDESGKEAVLLDVQEKEPDFLFVGMGYPAQDIFFEEHRERLQVGVMMGVGGSFDVLSGIVKRAPLWIRKINMEWAYRFAQRPSRLGRFIALPRFVLAVRRQKKAARVYTSER